METNDEAPASILIFDDFFYEKRASEEEIYLEETEERLRILLIADNGCDDSGG